MYSGHIVYSGILGTCLRETSDTNVFPLEFVKEDFSAVVRILFNMLLSHHW